MHSSQPTDLNRITRFLKQGAEGSHIYFEMIKGVMIINNHGKPRLTKFYEHLVRVALRARAGGCLQV